MFEFYGDITYIIDTKEIVWGGTLLAATLLIHGFGMVMTLHLTNSFSERLSKSGSPFASMSSILVGSWLIMVVHIAEIMVWAGFFQWQQCFVNFSNAVYFAGLQYTTVGSALHLPQHWRMLEPVIAGAGMLSFAWSAGVLMTLALTFQKQHLDKLRALTMKRQKLPSSATSPQKSDKN